MKKVKFSRFLINWKNDRINQSPGVICPNALRFVGKKRVYIKEC